MKTLAASVFVYLCYGAMSFAQNYFKARTIVGDERLRATLRPLALICAVVLWLPYMIAMQFHNPLRQAAMKQAQEMLRGPSIEPMMPMHLPEACKHIDLRGFQAIWPTETPPEVKTATVLWCKSCGALSANDGETWEKPQDVLYLPMPPALKNLKSHEDVPS